MNDKSTQIAEDIRQNELLTVKEVATYLRVNRVTVWRWCQRGIIPAAQFGRNWRIRRDDLLRLIDGAESPNLDPIEMESTSEYESNGDSQGKAYLKGKQS